MKYRHMIKLDRYPAMDQSEFCTSLFIIKKGDAENNIKTPGELLKIQLRLTCYIY